MKFCYGVFYFALVAGAWLWSAPSVVKAESGASAKVGLFRPALEGAVRLSATSQCLLPQLELELDSLGLKGLDGKPASVSGFENKKVVLYFWSIYCRSCVDGIDDLEALRQELKSRDVELLTVHLFEPRPDRVLAAAERIGTSLPIYLASKEVRDLFSIRSLPTSLVFDDEHRLVTRLEGQPDMDGLRLGPVETLRFSTVP